MMEALILQALDSLAEWFQLSDQSAPYVRSVLSPSAGTILRFTGRGNPAFSASSITVAEHRAS